MFAFSSKSRQNLDTVVPALQSIVERALEITDVDFSVVEGLRTRERQRHLMNTGKSWTMKSHHLTGHAVDLYPYVNGATSHETEPYNRVAKAMFTAAQQFNTHGLTLEWGGFWKQRDKPHWQLVTGSGRTY